MQQDINSKPLSLSPNVRPQKLHRPTTKTTAAMATHDKKLSQVNLIRLLSVKCVGDNRSVVLKNHCSILTRKKTSHPLLKLGQCHKAVPMAFVL